MTTTVADGKHYDTLARQHEKAPDAFVGAARKSERATTTAKPDIAAASGKGVPATTVAPTKKGC